MKTFVIVVPCEVVEKGSTSTATVKQTLSVELWADSEADAAHLLSLKLRRLIEETLLGSPA
jgi:hypothetical protein